MLQLGIVLNQYKKYLRINIFFFKIVKEHRKEKAGKAKKGKFVVVNT